MTIDEAIKMLTLNLPTDQWNRDAKQLAALKLGIEALERVESAHKLGAFAGYGPLPGETTE